MLSWEEVPWKVVSIDSVHLCMQCMNINSPNMQSGAICSNIVGYHETLKTRFYDYSEILMGFENQFLVSLADKPPKPM